MSFQLIQLIKARRKRPYIIKCGRINLNEKIASAFCLTEMQIKTQ